MIKKHILGLHLIIILGIALISGLIYNAFSENGIALVYRPLSITTGSEITVNQFYQILRQESVLLIDVRNPENFEIGHLQGAVNLPATSSTDEILLFFEFLPLNKAMILYGAEKETKDCHAVADLLVDVGYEKVFIFPGTLDQLAARGFNIINQEM